MTATPSSKSGLASPPLDLPRGEALSSSSGMNHPKPSSKSFSPAGLGVQCLRCEGSGHLSMDCDLCSGKGSVALSCRKCSGTGTYSQEPGPCSRCEAKGVLRDGTTCPRCKGLKTQKAFSSACAKCSGSGSVHLPCKKCHGSLKVIIDCKNCNGTGIYRREPGSA
jgi:DnaJ-class molecular chaperone